MSDIKLIDVHCHLDDERYEKDFEKVLERAKESGVKFIFSSGVNPKTNRKVLELSEKNEMVKACFGLYPIDVLFKKYPDLKDDDSRRIDSFDYKEELKWIEQHKENCVAIGEVGMDFKVIKEHDKFKEIKEEQEKIFEEIILFTKKLDLPIVIHSRGAELKCIELLEKHKMKKVLMHCFGGRKALIKRCVENGWYLSVPAVITRLDHFKTLVSIVSLEQLLTETDGPYLAPVYGERSESKDVLSTIKELSKIKNLSEKEVADQIWKNAESLFGKLG